ncbi:hypothetical protein OIO03_23340, partial [Acinetobacter baumannii]|nr:hypothetical protein [Acinetobacter baumannii]MCW1766541.1 hypothetical protein [Acinetobacter baumannii]
LIRLLVEINYLKSSIALAIESNTCGISSFSTQLNAIRISVALSAITPIEYFSIKCLRSYSGSTS